MTLSASVKALTATVVFVAAVVVSTLLGAWGIVPALALVGVAVLVVR